MFERAHHRQRSQTAERAKRTCGHRVAKIAQQFYIIRAIAILDDAIDNLNSASRSDATGRAFAARFQRAEFHRIARHLSEVSGIVEDHDAAMTQETASACHRLVINRKVEHRVWKVSAERTTHLHRSQRTTTRRAAAQVFNQFTQRQAEGQLEKSRALDVARKLKRKRAARSSGTELIISLAAEVQNRWNRSERNN